MKDRSVMAFEWIVAVFLLAVTVFVLYAQRAGMQRVLEITGDERLIQSPLDDRELEGASVAILSERDGKLVVGCNIQRASYQWPYCEVKFDVDPELAGSPGLDLSRYTHVHVGAYYSDEFARSANATLRLQLRNFNPIYSDMEADANSLKYNGIEYRPEGRETSIPMSSIKVYSWWIAQHPDLPIKYHEPEVDDIRVIELATGNYMRSGQHEIIVDHITFTGPLFNSQVVNLALLYVWAAAIVVVMLVRLLMVRQRLRQASKRQQELSAINRMLNVRKAELEEKAVRDPLTGALNREGLQSFIDQDLHQGEMCLSVVFIDLDHFKAVNDNFGHAIGDVVLKEFVQRIESQTRESDLFARWGGEEFVLCCPNTSLAEAAILAEKLRGDIERYQWPEGVKVTASFGVAQYGDESFTTFFKRADDALYKSKTKGRNRVSVAP